MSVDPLADFDGQQVLSPYHAMGGNPVSMVDPLGLQYFAPGSKIPNNAIPNAGVAFVEGKMVILGGAKTFNFAGDYASYQAFHAEFVKEQMGEDESKNGGQSNDALGSFRIRGANYAINYFSGSLVFSEILEPVTVTDGKANWLDWSKRMFSKYGSDLKGLTPQANEAMDWYGPGGQANWFLGAAGTGLEKTTGSFRLTNGAYNGSAWSPKYYASGWAGGSRARITTYNISRIGKGLGYFGAGVGVAMDIKGVINYYDNPNSPNAVHPAKAGVNTGMSAYGLFINPAAPMLYFGVDAFYPGGWLGNGSSPGAIMDVSRMIDGNQLIIPNFNIYRDIPGGW